MINPIVPPPDAIDKPPFVYAPVYAPLTLLEQAYAELTARQNRDEEAREAQEREDYQRCESSLRKLLFGLFGSSLDAYRPLPLFVHTLHNSSRGDLPFLCCALDGLRFAVSLNPFYCQSLSLLMPCGETWQIANDETALGVLADVAQVVEDWHDLMRAYHGKGEGEQ